MNARIAIDLLNKMIYNKKVLEGRMKIPVEEIIEFLQRRERTIRPTVTSGPDLSSRDEMSLLVGRAMEIAAIRAFIEDRSSESINSN